MNFPGLPKVSVMFYLKEEKDKIAKAESVEFMSRKQFLVRLQTLHCVKCVEEQQTISYFQCYKNVRKT